MENPKSDKMDGFILVLVAVGVTAAVGGVLLLVLPGRDSRWLDVGKATLAFAAAIFVGGFVAAWLKRNDQQREATKDEEERQREIKNAWSELLQDIVDAKEKMEVACQLVKAHKTAKTYSEQNVKILEVRATLRRVETHPLVMSEGDAEGSICYHLDKMREYVEELASEYVDHYLAVGRQQRIDERYLVVYINDLVGGPGRPNMKVAGYPDTDQVFKATESWDKLTRGSAPKFDRLNAFLNAFDTCHFQASFSEVRKAMIERTGVTVDETSAGESDCAGAGTAQVGLEATGGVVVPSDSPASGAAADPR